MIPIYSWMCGLQWRAVYALGDLFLKKTVSLSQKLPTSQSFLVKGGNVHHHSLIKLCLSWYFVSLICAVNMWVHGCSCPAVSRKQRLLVLIPHLLLWHSSHPLFLSDLWPWDEVVWLICPIWVMSATAFSSLKNSKFWLSMIEIMCCNQEKEMTKLCLKF